MSSGVRVLERIIPHVRISVKVLRVGGVGHNRIRLHKAAQSGVVISSPIIHQSRAFVKFLAGEGVVGGQGVVEAGTDAAPRVVALGDGFLAIGTVAHVGGAEVVGTLTSLKSAEGTEQIAQCPQSIAFQDRSEAFTTQASDPSL